MINGSTRGRGGSALGRHLADTKRQNDLTKMGSSRGLVTDNIKHQIRELTDIVMHSGHSKPLYHIHVDPSIDYTEEQWAKCWQDFEEEFHLERQQFAEAIHVKDGREHRHRVYSLVKPGGACIRMDFDYIRRERLCRLAELANGEQITKGAHNRAVIRSLIRDGMTKQAEVLEKAGIQDGERPVAKTPKERAQEERTGYPKENIDRIAYTCWMETRSLDAESFQDALQAWGLCLAQGDKVPVLLDNSGNCYPLLRSINAGSKEEKSPLKLRKKELDSFLSTLTLPSFKRTKIELSEERNKVSDIFKKEDYNFNLGEEYETRDKDLRTNERGPKIPQRLDKFKRKDVQQHIRHIGFDTKTRRWTNGPYSGNQGFVDRVNRKSERNKRYVATNIAKARLRVGLQDSHLKGILTEYQLDKPKLKVRKFDAYLMARIKREVKKDEPDLAFLQVAYVCMAVHYVQKYPKAWHQEQKEDDALKALMELALAVLNLISELLFGVSFIEASYEFQDDLAYDVKNMEDYKNKKELDYGINKTTP